MDLTNFWSCCSFLLVAGFLAVYLLIGYLIAFGFELLWLLESTSSLPTAAILLCTGYFCLALFCTLLLHGLATKNTTCLLAWMFAITILTFPEAGLVIYMSIQYWRIESVYGITELACWLARILASLVQVVLVHLLYSTWKEEEMVAKRLQDLSLTAVTIPRELGLVNTQLHQSNGYDSGVVDPANSAEMYSSLPHAPTWSGSVLNNMTVPNPSGMPGTLYPYPMSLDAYHYVYMTQSEFNASVFLNNKQMDVVKKSQSLTDLRSLHMINEANEDKKELEQRLNDSQDANDEASMNYTLSLDRRTHPAKLPRFASMDALNQLPEPITNTTSIIRNRSGLYARPIADYGVPIYYGPLDGPDFLIYKKQIDNLNSKNSLSNVSTDDVQKYRDVAL